MDEKYGDVGLFPIAIEVEEGKTYVWCGCGKSLTPPFCDKNECGEQSVSYVASLTEDVYFCNCKQTNNPPWCDGSHRHLLLEAVKNRQKK